MNLSVACERFLQKLLNSRGSLVRIGVNTPRGTLADRGLQTLIHLPWLPKHGSDDTGIRTLPAGLRSLCSARRHRHPTPTGLREESKGRRRRGWYPEGSRRPSFRTDTLEGISRGPGPGSKAGELSGGGGLKPGQARTSDCGERGPVDSGSADRPLFPLFVARVPRPHLRTPRGPGPAEVAPAALTCRPNFTST